MNLKEKFYKEIKFMERAENCEKITEDFAIGFFNWATSYKANDKNNWILTTKQLLEIYKDETTNK